MDKAASFPPHTHLMSERPKRTTRKSTKLLEYEEIVAPSVASSSRPKRKAKDVEVNDASAVAAVDDPSYLLQNPKSALTTMDISDLINGVTWDMLSPDSQAVLSRLLPPTALKSRHLNLDPYHPSQSQVTSDDMVVDEPSSSSVPIADDIDPSVFSDSHFLAAAHTFQDHIYSGWLSDAHKAKVKQYEEGIQDGSLAAPWKDDEWEKENTASTSEPRNGSPRMGGLLSAARAGEAAEIRLYELVQNSVVRVGDIIAYRRHFTALNLVIEKDVLIFAVNPKAKSMIVLLESGTTQHIPPSLLFPDPPDPGAPTQKMEITSPSMLETGILDVDGRVERTKRPHGNAWKSFTIYRWRGDAIEMQDSRGGRENHGTLFYLRGCFYSDR